MRVRAVQFVGVGLVLAARAEALVQPAPRIEAVDTRHGGIATKEVTVVKTVLVERSASSVDLDLHDRKLAGSKVASRLEPRVAAGPIARPGGMGFGGGGFRGGLSGGSGFRGGLHHFGGLPAGYRGGPRGGHEPPENRLDGSDEEFSDGAREAATEMDLDVEPGNSETATGKKTDKEKHKEEDKPEVGEKPESKDGGDGPDTNSTQTLEWDCKGPKNHTSVTCSLVATVTRDPTFPMLWRTVYPWEQTTTTTEAEEPTDSTVVNNEVSDLVPQSAGLSNRAFAYPLIWTLVVLVTSFFVSL